MIIGLTGLAGSGKTTVARHLMGMHGFVRHRMAEPLKSMLKTLGLTEQQIDGDLKEVPCELLGGKTPRHAMQTLGTEWGRDLISQNLWVKAWSDSLPHGRNVVVDDVRFLNEVETIMSIGGYIIHVDRGLKPTGSHLSERIELPFNFTARNMSDVQALIIEVDNILEKLPYKT